MPRQEIELGTAPLGEGGDNARTAFERINAMTSELYQSVDALAGNAESTSEQLAAAEENIDNLQSSREFRLVPGENINIDRSDPDNPVISAVVDGGSVDTVAGVAPVGGDIPVAPLAAALGMDSKVDKVDGKGLSANDFTDALYQKLSGLEGSKFQGLFVSLEALQVAVPAGEPGWYAHIDPGTGGEATAVAIWDDDDAQWIIQAGSGGEMTPSQILAGLLANPDVNVLTDDEYALVDTIADKVDKVPGKGLSTEDYTTTEKARLASAVVGTDARLSDAREWSAGTISQAEAEAGESTERRAWNALRVRQAVSAWWNTASSVFGRGLVAAADAAAGRLALGLGSAATRSALGAGSLYARDSILGVVSQTAGVPTGAIIERGSNANGQYSKYADGTLICVGDFPSSGSASANANFFLDWTYPHSFLVRPVVVGVPQPNSSPDIYGYLWDSDGAGGLIKTTLVFKNGATAQAFSIRVMAVGRWY